MSKTTCLNCGKLGHMVRDCTKAIDQEAVKDSKKKTFRNSDTKR